MPSEPTRATLTARVLEAIPDAVYQNRVYEQDVVVEVGTGQRLLLFDCDMLVPPEFVDKRCVFELQAFLPVLEPSDGKYALEGFVPEARRGLVVLLTDSAWDAYRQNLRSRYGVTSIIHNRSASGRVLELIGADKFILDVGMGTISVYYDSKRYSIDAGDQVRILDFRLDLKHVALASKGP